MTEAHEILSLLAFNTAVLLRIAYKGGRMEAHLETLWQRVFGKPLKKTRKELA